MITIAILASLGHEEELAMHIRATQNTGASVSDVKEVLLHLGIYAGVPCSNSAYKVAKKVYQELEHLESSQYYRKYACGFDDGCSMESNSNIDKRGSWCI